MNTELVAIGSALGPYRKLIAPVLGAIGFAIVPLLRDGTVGPQDAVQLAVVAATALTVYVVPNLRRGVGAVLKTVAAVVVGVGGLWLTVSPDGVTPAETAELVIAALIALGVYVAPNDPPPSD